MRRGRGAACRPNFSLVMQSQVPLRLGEGCALNSEHGYMLLVPQLLGLSHSCCSSPLPQWLFSFPCWVGGGEVHSAAQAQLLTELSVMLIQVEKNPHLEPNNPHSASPAPTLSPPCPGPVSGCGCSTELWSRTTARQRPSGSGEEQL